MTGQMTAGESALKLLTPEQVAASLQVSPLTVRNWLRTGKLQGVKVGKAWRIREEDLEAVRAVGLGYTFKHPGHAPGHIREALADAFDNAPDDQDWWQTFPRPEDAFVLLGKLWSCSDVVPSILRDQIADWVGEDDLRHGCTYAQAVRVLKAELSATLEQGRQEVPR